MPKNEAQVSNNMVVKLGELLPTLDMEATNYIIMVGTSPTTVSTYASTEGVEDAMLLADAAASLALKLAEMK